MITASMMTHYSVVWRLRTTSNNNKDLLQFILPGPHILLEKRLSETNKDVKPLSVQGKISKVSDGNIYVWNPAFVVNWLIQSMTAYFVVERPRSTCHTM